MDMQFFPNHFKPKPQIIRQIPIIMLGKGNLKISTTEPAKSHLSIGIELRKTWALDAIVLCVKARRSTYVGSVN